MSTAPNSKYWYLFLQGEYYGPYTKEQLVSFSREGRIIATNYLWDSEAEVWITAEQVEGLFFEDGLNKENFREGKFKGLKAVVLISIVLLAIAAAGILLNNIQSDFFAQEVFKEEVRGVIGPQGGELYTSGNEIRLEVPAGALAQETEIIIAVNEQLDYMGPDQASDVYEITGLEQTYKPVAVRIKTTTPLTGETYVTIGSTGYMVSEDLWDLTYQYLTGKMEGETIAFTIPPRAEGFPVQETTESSSLSLFTKVAHAQEETADAADVPLQAAVITNQQSATAAQERFRIIAPGDITAADIEQIKYALEYSYTFFKKHGFRDDWGRLDDFLIYITIFPTTISAGDWPLNVYIMDYWLPWRQNSDGFFVENRYKNNAHLEINANLIRNNSSDLWPTIMHEYCHFIQWLHGAVYNLWFAEMMAVWSEEFAWRPENVSMGVNSLYLAFGLGHEHPPVLDGPINHSGRRPGRHGPGSWPYLRYLIQTPEESKRLAGVMDKIYQKQYASDLEILEDLRPGISSWINEFYIALTTGILPGDTFGHPIRRFDPDPRTTNPTPVVTLDLDSVVDEGGITYIQGLEIPGYGARGVLLELDTALSPDAYQDMALTLTSSSAHGRVNLIQLDSTPAKLLEGEASEINLNSLASLVAARRSPQALVLVTNTSPQCGRFDIEITVTEDAQLDFTGNWDLFIVAEQIHYQEQMIVDDIEGNEFIWCPEVERSSFGKERIVLPVTIYKNHFGVVSVTDLQDLIFSLHLEAENKIIFFIDTSNSSSEFHFYLDSQTDEMIGSFIGRGKGQKLVSGRAILRR